MWGLYGDLLDLYLIPQSGHATTITYFFAHLLIFDYFLQLSDFPTQLSTTFPNTQHRLVALLFKDYTPVESGDI